MTKFKVIKKKIKQRYDKNQGYLEKIEGRRDKNQAWLEKN